MSGPRIPDLNGIIPKEMMPALQPIKDMLEIHAGQRANSGTERRVSAAEANALAEFGYLLIVDEKASNTAGGTFTSGAWQTRDLNTVKTERNIAASLNSNQILLEAGLYVCRIICPAFRVRRHKARLRNITDGTDILYGTSESSDNAGAYAATSSVISGFIDLTTPKLLEVQHRCEITSTTVGFGTETNFGVPEIYTVAEFWKQRSI